MLETRLSDDPVYKNYLKKMEACEKIKEKLRQENLENPRKLELIKKLKKTKRDLTEAQENLRSKL